MQPHVSLSLWFVLNIIILWTEMCLILIVSFKELKDKAKKLERSNRVRNLTAYSLISTVYPILKCPVIVVIRLQKLTGCMRMESQDWA